MLSNGVWATAAGMALWLVSLAMETRDTLKPGARALLAPAWMAIGIGVALLVLHVLQKRRTQAEANMLLRQHSTFLEPMPRLPPRQDSQAVPRGKDRHAGKPRSAASSSRSSRSASSRTPSHASRGTAVTSRI